jgi:kynurenine formamidase
MTDFRELGRKLSNWGRWGADDQIGTINLLTPERVASAAGLVHTGARFSLSIPLDEKGPQPGRGRINPIRMMRALGPEQAGPGAFRFTDDVVFMPLQAGTQWDALSHVYYDDLLYNGYPATDALSVRGAARCSIDQLSAGVTGRGVLLDVARFLGRDWLDAGEAITPEVLTETVAAQSIEVGPGDIVAVRTGWRRKFLRERDRDGWMSGEPGLSLECASWLRERDVAAICSDNWAVEVLPDSSGGDGRLPLHLVLIRDVGMTLGEMFDLEELATACAADGRYDYLFCGPPLRFTGAVGSPVNPIAIR